MQKEISSPTGFSDRLLDLKTSLAIVRDGHKAAALVENPPVPIGMRY